MKFALKLRCETLPAWMVSHFSFDHKGENMKKLTLSFLIVILLAACQPAPTPEPTPIVTETLANSVSLVQGVWYDPGFGGQIMSINGSSGSSDLTFSVYNLTTSPYLHQGEGTAKFEDGKLTYLTDDGICIYSPQATYEIYIIKEDGFITSMRQKPVGSDNCAERADASSNVFYYSGLAAMPKGTERPAKRSNELIGLWYAESGLLLDYQLGRLDPATGNADITIALYWTRVDPWMEIGTGTARYENGKLIFLTNAGSCEGTAETTYEINMIIRNDKIIGMHPKVVGDDLCKDRKDTLNDRNIRRVNQ
jgi:hypothetical protein